MARRMMFWSNKDKKSSVSHTDLTESMSENAFEEKDVGLVSLFGPFLKNLSKTSNPAKLPYPTQFYLPQSTLMHMVHLQMSHIDLLINATMQATPEERFLGVLQHAISSWALTKFPYKPIISILGETAHYSTAYAGSSDPSDRTYVIAENLRKDPPISCYHIDNAAHGLSYEGAIEMVPKFKQAHVHVQFLGQNTISIRHPQGLFHEEFRCDVPDLMIRLLRMHTELGGEVNVHSSTGYSAKIVFKEKGLLSKAKNQLSGTITHNGVSIYIIDGAWDDVVYLTDCRTSVRSELLNRASIRTNPLQAAPPSQTPMTACDKIWSEMLASLLRQDFNTAAVLKQQINQDEVRILAEMQQSPENYNPRYFRKNAAGAWEIKDPILARDASRLSSISRNMDPSLEQKYANVHSTVNHSMLNNQGSYAPQTVYTSAPNVYTTPAVYTTTSPVYMPTM